MARQNLRLLALAVCTLSVLASDDEREGLSPPQDPVGHLPARKGPPRRRGTNGMGKPRPNSSDPKHDEETGELLSEHWEEGRREGIITKVQSKGEVAIMVRYKNPGEIKDIHCRQWDKDYRQILDLEKPIKGDIVKFTVLDASLETSRRTAGGEVDPKDGRVRAADVVKVGVLSLADRRDMAESHGYEMSQPLNDENDTTDWRSMAQSVGSSKRTNSKRGSRFGAASTRGDERELDWGSVRAVQLPVDLAVDRAVDSDVPTSASPPEDRWQRMPPTGSACHDVPDPAVDEWMAARLRAAPVARPQPVQRTQTQPVQERDFSCLLSEGRRDAQERRNRRGYTNHW